MCPSVVGLQLTRRPRAARPRRVREGGGRARAQPRASSTACCARTPTRASRRAAGRHGHADRLGRARAGAGAVGEEPPAGAGDQGPGQGGAEGDRRPPALRHGEEGLRDRHLSGGRATEVDRGSRVRLFVSSGPEQIDVPDVVGLTREHGRDPAHARGPRRACGDGEDSDETENEVIAQSPAAGDQLDRGDHVTITVAPRARAGDVPERDRAQPRTMRSAAARGQARHQCADARPTTTRRTAW